MATNYQYQDDTPPLSSQYFQTRQDYEGYLKGEGAKRGAYEGTLAARMQELEKTLGFKTLELGTMYDFKQDELDVMENYYQGKLRLEERGQDIQAETAVGQLDWASMMQDRMEPGFGDYLEKFGWGLAGEIGGSWAGSLFESDPADTIYNIFTG